jgi:glucose-6-phosphate isomerase
MNTSSDEQFLYDYTFMMADSVGEHGATEQELAELQPRLEQIQQDFLAAKDNNELGFAMLPFDDGMVTKVQQLAKQVRQEFSTLVVLGIGGSDLGARALHQALNHTFYNQLDNQNHRLFFAGDNTDPKELADLLDVLDLEQTAFNVISKSGDTVETMSAFVYLRQKLAEAVGEENVAKHIIVSTDAEKGSLRTIVNREEYRSLVVPANVGGRFSVLSTVGLFPAAYVGIEIADLLAGAAEMDEQMAAAPVAQNPAMLYAALQYLGYTKRHQSLSVVMPYADGLRGVAMWYRQLWAESLGKKEMLNGQVVNSGPTPIAAVGATDQHSQVQLYMEGPFDKLITFITVTESSRSVLLADGFDAVPELAYLQGAELNDLLLTEANSTAIALAHNQRPNGTIVLPKLDEFYLGQLLYFFEVACAYSGALYEIDTYNQPGVELGKQLMYGQLGKKGYETVMEPFEHLLHPPKRYQC